MNPNRPSLASGGKASAARCSPSAPTPGVLGRSREEEIFCDPGAPRCDRSGRPNPHEIRDHRPELALESARSVDVSDCVVGRAVDEQLRRRPQPSAHLISNGVRGAGIRCRECGWRRNNVCGDDRDGENYAPVVPPSSPDHRAQAIRARTVMSTDGISQREQPLGTQVGLNKVVGGCHPFVDRRPFYVPASIPKVPAK